MKQAERFCINLPKQMRTILFYTSHVFPTFTPFFNQNCVFNIYDKYRKCSCVVPWNPWNDNMKLGSLNFLSPKQEYMIYSLVYNEFKRCLLWLILYPLVCWWYPLESGYKTKHKHKIWNNVSNYYAVAL